MNETTRRAIGDLVLVALVWAGAALLVVGAADLPPPRFEPLGSAALPRILATILVALGGVVALRALVALRTGRTAEPAAEPDAGGAGRSFAVLALLLLYVLALDLGRVPFVVATTVFVAAVGVVLGRRTLRGLALHAALGLGLSLGISTILARFLYVSIG